MSTARFVSRQLRPRRIEVMRAPDVPFTLDGIFEPGHPWAEIVRWAGEHATRAAAGQYLVRFGEGMDRPFVAFDPDNFESRYEPDDGMVMITVPEQMIRDALGVEPTDAAPYVAAKALADLLRAALPADDLS